MVEPAGAGWDLRSVRALACVERGLSSFLAGVGGSGWIWGPAGGRWNTSVAVGITAIAGIALVATIVVTTQRGGLKSPWSPRRRKDALIKQHWDSFFTLDGKFHDGGVKFLKKVRSGGVDPSIRHEVWPFLLGVYNLDSSSADRNEIKAKNREEYMKLRKECLRISIFCDQEGTDLRDRIKAESKGNPADPDAEPMNDKASDSNAENPLCDKNSSSELCNAEEEEKSSITHIDASDEETTPLDNKSTAEEESAESKVTSPTAHNQSSQKTEDFATWQRIIRLDAIRANAEWATYSPTQAAVSKDKAIKSANAVNLTDYDHLEPRSIYHAARLVAVLEAYAVHDPEIGYCQGMSDLLSPILAVMEEDDEAFWCFVGFMKKARHNFRLDEVGIRRQLNTVSRIIKFKDSHLYTHLEKLQAEDCFFVYRMVVVMFRRELTFEQTLCLWEVMWADQAANRAGFGKSAWGGSVRLRAPPTDDLLLYAIAACVLQRRKLIIERYTAMDEIIRECNSMAGQLDVWKLLDDAHDLVVTLHDKIE